MQLTNNFGTFNCTRVVHLQTAPPWSVQSSTNTTSQLTGKPLHSMLSSIHCFLITDTKSPEDRWTDVLTSPGYRGSMTTCHRAVSMILKVHTSPTLIPLSWQNLFIPVTWWLLLSYGVTRTCQDKVLLIDVLRVILQGPRIPIALQKTGGKYCKNCYHNDQLTYFSKQLPMIHVPH